MIKTKLYTLVSWCINEKNKQIIFYNKKEKNLFALRAMTTRQAVIKLKKKNYNTHYLYRGIGNNCFLHAINNFHFDL